MEVLPSNLIIKFNPNTLEEVRKDVNLDSRTLKEAIDILENWVRKQTHFNKKDFSRTYLESGIIASKGSVEKAKQKLDKICTMRTLLPQFFVWNDPKQLFQDVEHILSQAHLVKLTKDNFRAQAQILHTDDFKASDLFKVFLKIIMISEYLRKNDYSSGYHLIFDISKVNVLNLVTKLNPIDLNNIMTILMEGYGMRTKGIHIITPSKMVDTLVKFLKQVLSPKLRNRIFVHKTVETLYQYVPKDVLPVDFGGYEKSLKELNDDWLKTIDTEDFKNYYEEMLTANTNESLRPTDKFNEEYIGTPGSFRTLTVD